MTRYLIDNCGDLSQLVGGEADLMANRGLMKDAEDGDAYIIRVSDEGHFERAEVSISKGDETEGQTDITLIEWKPVLEDI